MAARSLTSWDTTVEAPYRPPNKTMVADQVTFIHVYKHILYAVWGVLYRTSSVHNKGKNKQVYMYANTTPTPGRSGTA